MGTWAHGPFDNDTASDWVYGLEEHEDFSLVEQALQSVLDTGTDYLDADLAVEAVAASEALAIALGRGTQPDDCPESVATWLASLTTKPPAELLHKAQAALVRVLGPDSELRELWEDSEEFEAWQSSMHALQSAVGA